MISVLFFASLRDQLDCDKLELSIEQLKAFQPGAPTTADLINYLCHLNPNWQVALTDQKLFTAVNQDIINKPCVVQDNDEVAFFPPVTGG